MVKNKRKISLIILIVMMAILVLAGISTGIYLGVKTVACEGYIKESGNNQALANVAVTDGKNVVKTNFDGYFKLKGWFKARFVTVTIPDGYWTEKYYLEINKNSKEYNFTLDKTNTDNTKHNFLQVSDTEVGKDGVGEWINDVKDVVAKESPAFIIQTGDICYEDGLKSHIKGMNSENMGVPVRYAMGNHDFVGKKYGEQLFEDIYGPVCYSFDIGQIHYIVTPMVTYTEKPGKYSRSDVWRWVANDLANKDDDKKVVMFNHDYAPDENGFVLKTATKKIDLKENDLIAWVFGHWHYNFVNNIDGILNICTGKPDAGGVDGSPNAIRTVDIEGGKIVDTQLHYAMPTLNADTDYIWQSSLKGRILYAEPIVVGDKAFVATMTDNFPSNCGISCIDMTTGKIVWQFDTINSVRNSMNFKDGKLVFQDVEGRVYCLDSDNGTQLWQTDCKLENPKNTTKAITIDGNFVYCGNEEKITCLKLDNGGIVWQKKRVGNSSSASRFVVYDKYLIVGSHWDRLLCFDKTTKKQLWKTKKGMFITTTPICYDGKVLLLSGNKMLEYNISNGKLLREKEFKDYNFDTAAQPLISDGIAYITTVNKGVVAIKMSNMEILWNFETRESLLFTSPYSGPKSKTVDATIKEKDGSLYFGASDGYVYRIDKTTGTKQSEFCIGMPIFSSIAFYGDNILVTDFGGRATLLHLSK